MYEFNQSSLEIARKISDVISKEECQALLDQGQSDHNVLLFCCGVLIVLCCYLFWAQYLKKGVAL
jgi:hypothetical protein